MFYKGKNQGAERENNWEEYTLDIVVTYGMIASTFWKKGIKAQRSEG